MKILNFFRRKRKIKKLLQILLENEKYFNTGLCKLAVSLSYRKIINDPEIFILWKYIEENRPVDGSIHFDEDSKNFPYFWPAGEWKPRKLWLEDLLQYQRPKKQLLSLLLSHGEQYVNHGGLCLVTLRLKDDEIINEREYASIMNFIVTHKPKPNSKHYVDMSIYTKNTHLHYWPIGEWQPRKSWLEDQIKSL